MIDKRNEDIYLELRECPVCAKVFDPNGTRRIYCSPRCYALNNAKCSLERYYKKKERDKK